MWFRMTQLDEVTKFLKWINPTQLSDLRMILKLMKSKNCTFKNWNQKNNSVNMHNIFLETS